MRADNGHTLSNLSTMPPSKKAVVISEQLGDGGVRRYERGKLLGEGGFARCYEVRALDSRGGAATAAAATAPPLAAKVLRKQRLSAALAAQLREEIAIHRDVSAGEGHPHVLRFFGAFEDARCWYLLLEVARHGTLAEVLARRKRLTEPECQYWVPQLLSGLTHLEALGVVHRDLTPSNLFIDREAAGDGGGALCLRIADFGLAERLVGGCESAPNCCGTPSYMPPEVLRSSHISGHEVLSTDGGHSHASDMWCVGVALFQMLAGRTPFAPSRDASPETCYKRIKEGAYTWPVQLPISTEVVDLVCPVVPYTVSSLFPISLSLSLSSLPPLSVCLSVCAC
jgi:serine/threonine protein kinase